MRWLFLLLLIINIIYVTWALQQDEKRNAGTQVKTNLPAIVLLREVDLKELVKINKIEPTKEPKVDVAEVQKVPEELFVEELPSEYCYTLGPFSDLKNLRSLTRAIKKDVLEASFRHREEKKLSRYWVYLKPAKTKKEAKFLSKLLVKRKVKDFFIINSGPQTNGISLGQFKEKDRAYAHAKQLQEKGFYAEIEPIFKKYSIYWLDYKVRADHDIPQSTFNKYITSSASHLVRDCS